MAWSLVALSLVGREAGAQSCVPALTRATVRVYRELPQYSTGGGWRFGPLDTTLTSQTPVRICAQQDVGFLGGSRSWLRIAFDVAGRERAGWIPALGTTTSPQSSGVANRRHSNLFLPAVAEAQDGLPQGGMPEAGALYVLAFLMIILGMAARVAQDHFSAPLGERPQYLSQSIRAFVVSPIAFLTFSRVGDFGIAGTHGFVIFLCMAFQNGFFWQVVLANAGQPGALRAPAPQPVVTAAGAAPGARSDLAPFAGASGH